MSLFRTQTQRLSTVLTDNWLFTKSEKPLSSATEGWQDVSVPHTWNAFDGQNGKAADPEYPAGYYRGPAWYVRSLSIPADWRGKRVFLRFEAASLVCDAYLNGRHLGQHRGGFTAFCFELTDHLSPEGRNELRVRVDNSPFEDIIPLSGDFTVGGGIYRPVHLFATDASCITPLDFGGSGLYLTQKQVSAIGADLEIEAKISSTIASSGNSSLRIEVLDADGRILQSAVTAVALEKGRTVSVKTSLHLDRPRLWNGRKDPYLHTVRASLLRDGSAIDTVEQPLGLRTVSADAKRGFLLNGQPYALHGVNRHQDRRDKGWALSMEDHEEDFRMIMEIGATALRLAHYPQCDAFLSLCDRGGLVLWEEIPVIEQVRGTEAFNQVTIRQMREMILQGYNHPSLAFWGIFNEVNAFWVKEPAGHIDPEPLLQNLRDLAHELDPSRSVVGAACSTDKAAHHALTDAIAFNNYPGWYWGTPEQFSEALIKASDNNAGGGHVALSEYGAGANIAHHEEGELKKPETGGPWHPEEWQACLHETAWSLAKKHADRLWGTFVWAMFDFASDARDEGGNPGVNDKGLVTQDRKIRKDAFYAYKANWNAQPMVHIASRRMTPRKNAVTEVKVYANTPSVELFVNGKSLGTAIPDDIKIARWKNVTLQPGNNRIEAISGQGSTLVTDRCDWQLNAAG
ncbi:MAG: glycoside hydrolase family 2 TIM barrel-domain containing protein [Opitutaceae bacterium]|jgi:beta-galactosidase